MDIGKIAFETQQQSATGANRPRHRPPRSADIPRISPLLLRLFSAYIERYLARHFHAVRLARTRAGSPSTIVPATLVLVGGQVLPVALLASASIGTADLMHIALATVGTVAAYSPRLTAARRFRQSLLGTALHPVAILTFLTMQWSAWLRAVLGRPATWKGQAYVPE